MPFCVCWLLVILIFSNIINAGAINYPVRAIDGSNNNIKNKSWGKAETAQVRQSLIKGILPRYRHGSKPKYPCYPNPRSVSNILGAQKEDIDDPRSVSYMNVFWGQFLAHETVLTPTDPDEPYSIYVSKNDPTWPAGTEISMFRSTYQEGTGYDKHNPRMQMNANTSFLDASIVYGSQWQIASSLREFKNGRLKVSEGNLLPRDSFGFRAGDERVDENPSLIALQTPFMREHNRLAAIIKNRQPNWNDERIYQAARKIVGAEIGAITINEYLKSLGVILPPYPGYDPTIDPSIILEFSTAVYRFGHSQSDSDELIVAKDGTETELPLEEVLFNPDIFNSELMDGILRGSGRKPAQKIDLKMVDALRNSIVSFPSGPGALDLYSIDIQRSRDHGMPDYNTVRKIFGLPKQKIFSDITRDKKARCLLEKLYCEIDEIDLFVGMLAEDHLPGKSVGELLNALLLYQFKHLRNGDRFWYENDAAFQPNGYLSQMGFDLSWINNRLLSRIITDNTDVSPEEIPEEIFIAKEARSFNKSNNF